MKYLIQQLIILSCILIIFSCKKFVEINPPEQQLESDKIFANEQTALMALNGLYVMTASANLSFLNGGVTLYTGLSSDEIYNTAPNIDADPIQTNSILPTHTNIYNRLWRPAYSNNYIYTANAVIEKLTASKVLNPNFKNQLLGEAIVIRSVGFFYLINLFGDVPLVVSTDFQHNSSLKRTPSNEIYKFIINDLITAKSLLRSDYPLVNRTRINKWGAIALLSRVYLYTEDWSLAESNATDVINSGLYELNSDLEKVFNLINSRETIWQASRDGINTVDGATYIPATSVVKPNYALTAELISAFDSTDLRKLKWIGKNTVGGVDYFYPFKYKSRTQTQPTEYQIIFRLAEQFLIRAEARANQDNLLGALEDLNLIRRRSGLDDFSTNNKEDLLIAIQNERRLEYFSELGHRWFDLKRTNKANEVLGNMKAPNWQPTDMLYPIPQTELERNPFLIQNPGY